MKHGEGNLPFLFMNKLPKLSKVNSKHIEFKLGELSPLFKEMWKRFEPMVFDKEAENVELAIHNNNFRIVANPNFWKKCGQRKRLFVICHEMCHVMFGHWLINPNMDREWCNIAQDIQINEFLMTNYFHDMQDEDFATIKMVFKHKSDIVNKGEDFKYYYELLMKCRS